MRGLFLCTGCTVCRGCRTHWSGDVRADTSSCNICTYAVRGGRTPPMQGEAKRFPSIARSEAERQLGWPVQLVAAKERQSQ